MSNSYKQPLAWNTDLLATNNTHPSNPPQQYGAPALAASVSLYPPRGVVTAAPVPHGHAVSQRPPISPTTPTAPNSIGSASSYDHYRAHQSPVVSSPPNASRPAEKRSLAGLGYHFDALEKLNWAPADTGGNIYEGNLPPTLSPGKSQQGWSEGHNHDLNGSPLPSQRSPQRHNPPPPDGEHDDDTDPGICQKNCIVPGCPYPAYRNYADKEQTEYCGQAHELEAIATGLVDTCVMCKGRPRRTGERVCGRTCREQAREAAQVSQVKSRERNIADKPTSSIVTGLVDACVVCKGRPRRTGERVCGRTCRERDREARQVQGAYYGSPVTRYTAKTRPGA